MIKGTVKFFNSSKGFGFIIPDDGNKEVFLPLATVAASGGGPLAAGQRVLFEAELEPKGPKVVKLKVLDEPPATTRINITLYHDPSSPESEEVTAALDAAGVHPNQVNYLANPPARDELKRLSLLLREADQSLARRYEPLFMELQLDDRFISDSDFWTAIHEHPSLIHGPVLANESRARICRTAQEARAFLRGPETSKQPKKISSRMLALMTGQPLPARPPKERDDTNQAAEPVAEARPVKRASTPAAKPKKSAAAPKKPPPAAKEPKVAKRVAAKAKPASKRKK